MHFVLSIAFDKHYVVTKLNSGTIYVVASDDLAVVFAAKEP